MYKSMKDILSPYVAKESEIRLKYDKQLKELQDAEAQRRLKADQALHDLKVDIIDDNLLWHKGNKSAVARALGIDLQTVYRLATRKTLKVDSGLPPITDGKQKRVEWLFNEINKHFDKRQTPAELRDNLRNNALAKAGYFSGLTSAQITIKLKNKILEAL
jgi:hypothetical protein